MGYQIVQQIEGASASIITDDLHGTAANLGLEIYGIETRANLRPCLQGQPKIRGYVGPCYGGEVDGVPVIRYEDAATYREMGA
ncbi:hypothetical protein [Falsirhodobacter sp. 1013]|uniref:hypothetical protein n=1 Tax=Falsirhodobacter sp. 1013 TaxID=3417566 RepID=UPI003EBE0B34